MAPIDNCALAKTLYSKTCFIEAQAAPIDLLYTTSNHYDPTETCVQFEMFYVGVILKYDLHKGRKPK